MNSKRPLHFHSCVVPFALLAAAATPAFADDRDPTDERVYIAPMASYVPADSSRANKDAFGATLAIGKPVLLPHLEVEAIATYLRYGSKTTTPGTSGPLCGLLGVGCATPVNNPALDVYGGGVGANLFPMATSGLFLHADVQGAKGGALYNAGLGYDVPVSQIALRLEALYHHSNGFDEPQINLGLRIPLGDKPMPPPPAPVAVVPAPEPAPPPPPPPPEPKPCQAPSDGQAAQLEGCKGGETLVLRGVNFDFDKANLTLNAKGLLDQVASELVKFPTIQVEIDGHTDGKGGDAYNQRLSEHRADAVKDYLATKGVDASRMTTRGFGKSMPVADNSTEEGRELNRRVEMKVVTAGATSATTSSEAPATTPATMTTAAPASESTPAAEPAVPATTSAEVPAETSGAAQAQTTAPAATPESSTGESAAASATAPEAAPAASTGETAPVPAAETTPTTSAGAAPTP